MTFKDGQKKTELLVYGAAWLVLFIVPFLWEYWQTGTKLNAIDRYELCRTYLTLSVFCVLFWLHNLFVAPRLVYKGQRWRYVLGLTLLTALFFGYLSYRQMVRRQFFEKMAKERFMQPPRPKEEEAMPPNQPLSPENARRRKNMGKGMEKNMGKNSRHKPWKPDDHFHQRNQWYNISGREMMLFWLFLLLLGVNVGVKYFFRTLNIKKRMLELEHENLNQQLAYLKYQINPHFFMNTLNNIHALVSIDPAKAEETIEVLSKLMRYVLYDGDKPLAPLEKETQFLNNYVELMRIRYASRVRIDLSLPEVTTKKMVPPLIFVTFVENAFKHGVSYERKSFIEVGLTVDEAGVRFTCRNSCNPSEDKSYGGVGLSNVRKRLDLIYHDAYKLEIAQNEATYNVCLSMPFLTSAEEQGLQNSNLKLKNKQAQPKKSS